MTTGMDGLAQKLVRNLPRAYLQCLTRDLASPLPLLRKILMNINFTVPEEWNVQRHKLNATWKEVVKAGLDALQNQPVVSGKIPASIENHLKQSLDGISSAWKLIKPYLNKDH
jgi:hypothetical protein